MLDETLVVFLTDFRRTPKINGNGGRDHHPGVYSLVLAGGGIQGGQVYGSSDAKGAEPGSDPCTPAAFMPPFTRQWVLITAWNFRSTGSSLRYVTGNHFLDLIPAPRTSGQA